MKFTTSPANAPMFQITGPSATVAVFHAPPGINGVTVGITISFTNDLTRAEAATAIINAMANPITLYSLRNSLNSKNSFFIVNLLSNKKTNLIYINLIEILIVRPIFSVNVYKRLFPKIYIKGGFMAKVNLLGSWAFLIGVIIAVLVGLGVWVSLSPTVVAVLVLLGLIIGLLTIGAKEVEPFVMASIAFLLAAYIGKDVLGTVTPIINLGSVLDAIIALVVPATVIVALKEVFNIAKK